MEGRYNADFSSVRVHTDEGAAAAAASVDAKAFTSGEHLVFSPGSFAPGSRQGQDLLAHELAHVVQQRAGPVDGKLMPGGLKVSDPGDRFEQAASRAASAGQGLLAHELAQTIRSGPPPAATSPGTETLSLLAVQRATEEAKQAARDKADRDFAADKTDRYFTGNFLANHIQKATKSTSREGSGRSETRHETRSQAYKALEMRSRTDLGGSGWHGGTSALGTNTLIIDYGDQLKYLMQALNVAALDAPPGAPRIDFDSEKKMRTLTFQRSGAGAGSSQKDGYPQMGAVWSAREQRYQIDHLSGVR
jgi:hypothetical protein